MTDCWRRRMVSWVMARSLMHAVHALYRNKSPSSSGAAKAAGRGRETNFSQHDDRRGPIPHHGTTDFLAYLPEVRRDDAGIGALCRLRPVDLREGPDRVEHDHASPAALEHQLDLHVAVGGQRR